MEDNRKKYFFYVLIFLTFACGSIIILQVFTLNKVETIDNKLEDGFNTTIFIRSNPILVDKDFTPLGVVGRDDRITRDQIHPANKQIIKSIGGVGTGVFRNGRWFAVSTGCTGTLYKKNYVITAAHCIQNTDNEALLGQLRSNIIFLPNLIRGSTTDVMVVNKIIRSNNYPKFGFNSRNQKHDWVILVVSLDAKDQYTNPITISDNNQNYPYFGQNTSLTNSFLSLFGYAADKSDLSIHERTFINNVDSGGALRTSADMNPGSSGGPMMETFINTNNTVNYVIHAVVSGHTCLQSEFIGVNCYTNRQTFPNILAPLLEAKQALEQYLLNNNLPNTEIANIRLDGPNPTNPPTPSPTPSTPVPVPVPSVSPNPNCPVPTPTPCRN